MLTDNKENITVDNMPEMRDYDMDIKHLELINKNKELEGVISVLSSQVSCSTDQRHHRLAKHHSPVS